jgi:hypothetical protein
MIDALLAVIVVGTVGIAIITDIGWLLGLLRERWR